MTNVENAVSTESPANRHWFFWFTIVAGIFYLAFFIFTGVMQYKYLNLDKYGYGIKPFRFEGVFISAVDPQGPAHGKLQPGDKILAVNGDQRFSRVGFYPGILRGVSHFAWLRSIPEGQSYVLRIKRGGIEGEVELSTSQVPASESLRERRWRDSFLPALKLKAFEFTSQSEAV